MSEIGVGIGFLILVLLLWSRLSAQRRRKKHEYRPTAKSSHRALPWRAPQVIDAVGQVEQRKAN